MVLLREAGFYIEVAGRACKHCRPRKDDVVKLRSIIEVDYDDRHDS